MAKVEDVIVRGRIGNLVFCRRNDTNYVRRIPDHVHNPKTQNQKEVDIISLSVQILQHFIMAYYLLIG